MPVGRLNKWKVIATKTADLDLEVRDCVAHGPASGLLGRSDETFVPQAEERVGLTANYFEVSNRWVQMMPEEPIEFRCLMIIGRNTIGRQKTWDRTANRYLAERVGWHRLTPTKGTDRARLIAALRGLEKLNYLDSRSGKPGTMNEWRLREDTRPFFGVERRYAKNEREDYKEMLVALAAMDALRKKASRGELLTDEEQEGVDNGFKNMRKAALYSPMFKTNFMQWANVFEDVMGPNIPRRLYRLIMRVWAETHGRLNHKRDRYGQIRPWRASVPYVGGETNLNDAGTIKLYVEFAERWGFLSVMRSEGMTHSYLPGPHMWRLVQTGDLSPAYRREFKVTTKPGHPALTIGRTRETAVGA